MSLYKQLEYNQILKIGGFFFLKGEENLNKKKESINSPLFHRLNNEEELHYIIVANVV